MMFENNYSEGLQDIAYCKEKAPKVSEHYILTGKLFHLRDELKRNGSRIWGDYGNVYDQCSKLATEMLSYKDHAVWKLIK